MTVVLRPYQTEAAEAAWSALMRCVDPLVVMATGTGKSPVFAEVARRWLSAFSSDVLVVAHRCELLSQATRHLREANTGPRVYVASVQALMHCPPPPNIGLLIIDEAHHSTCTTYVSLMRAIPGVRVMGVTATPDRADGRGLGRVFGEVAYRYDADRATREGYLAPVGRRSASSVGELLCLAGNRRTIVFADSVESSKKMAAAIGPRARHVDGDTPSRERVKILAEFGAGTVQFLCNCDLVTEGYDVPAVEVVAVMRRVGSRGLLAQMAGRGMRPVEGKRECLLVQLPDARELGLLPPREVLADGVKVKAPAKKKAVRKSRSVRLEPAKPETSRSGSVGGWLSRAWSELWR